MVEKAKRSLKQASVRRLLALVALAGLLWFGLERVEWGHKVDPGDFIVGVGTLALAVGTFALARHAKREIEGSERPYVVASPHPNHQEGLTFDTDSSGLAFWYRLWNIGRGPAVVTCVSFQEEEGKRELISFSTPRPLTVGGVADFGARVISHTTPLPKKFTLLVYYQDGSGRNYVTEMSMFRSDGSMVLVPITYFLRPIKLADLLAAFKRQS